MFVSYTIFAPIISNSQTRAKKKRTMDLFFVRYRVTSQKKNGEKRFKKKRSPAGAKCT